jgi:hypothetical protein
MKIVDIKKAEKDTKWESLCFKVTEVKKVESKEYEDKHWFEQPIKCVDEDKKTIKVVLNLTEKDNGAMTLNEQDTDVTFLECELNRYDTTIKEGTDKGKKITVNYLKCWGGWIAGKAGEPETQGNAPKIPDSDKTSPNTQNTIETPPKAQEAQKTSPVDWDSKEKRMVRMNCLSHATELVKSSLNSNDHDNAGRVQILADKFERFVYEGLIKDADNIDTPF